MTIEPSTFIVTVFIVLLFFLNGCSRLSVDVWDRKKSDICEDHEEKSGDCRNGTGVIVGWRWIVRNYDHARQNQIRTTLKAHLLVTA
jgi:hypothetical protein